MSLAELLEAVNEDPWRETTAFSQDLIHAHEQMFAAESATDVARILNGWLRTREQPCIFGRLAALNGLISYCVLTEDDLKTSDEHVQARIDSARIDWLREAHFGRKSAFVILALSERLTRAVPDARMLAFAKRLLALYKMDDVAEDAVILDEIFLEKPGQTSTVWKWHVGANYFASNADGRWWRDHRIPGGVAFSMNSVGHLVKSAQLVEAMRTVESSLNAPAEGWDASRVNSLEKALATAMSTIENAHETHSGRATELLPVGTSADQMPVGTCPYSLPKSLHGKNFCTYRGYYHTDFTLPSIYFRPDVARPPEAEAYNLDFTYLFYKSPDNPSYYTMAEGRRIRAEQETQTRGEWSKQLLAAEESVLTEAQPLLKRALAAAI